MLNKEKEFIEGNMCCMKATGQMCFRPNTIYNTQLNRRSLRNVFDALITIQQQHEGQLAPLWRPPVFSQVWLSGGLEAEPGGSAVINAARFFPRRAGSVRHSVNSDLLQYPSPTRPLIDFRCRSALFHPGFGSRSQPLYDSQRWL